MDSFIKGMKDAPARDQIAIREEIMRQLGITSEAQFVHRKFGRVEHSPAERAAIEAVFANYAINEPWGDA